jgi:hypothetical protein
LCGTNYEITAVKWKQVNPSASRHLSLSFDPLGEGTADPEHFPNISQKTIRFLEFSYSWSCVLRRYRRASSFLLFHMEQLFIERKGRNLYSECKIERHSKGNVISDTLPRNTGHHLRKNREVEPEIIPRVLKCPFGKLLGRTLREISENLDIFG